MKSVTGNNSKGIKVIKIPNRLSNTEVITWLQSKDINWKYIRYFKHYSSLKDEYISKWLNISVRTLRNYSKPENKLKENIKEQLLLFFLCLSMVMRFLVQLRILINGSMRKIFILTEKLLFLI